jgi:hypothetical protein
VPDQPARAMLPSEAEIREHAISLVEPASPLTSPQETALTAPAADMFVTAFERLYERQHRVESSWTDDSLSDGEAWTAAEEGVSLRLEVDDGEGSSVFHRYTPDDAEQLGWTLLALAFASRHNATTEA